jgi:hypothetical protein
MPLMPTGHKLEKSISETHERHLRRFGTSQGPEPRRSKAHEWTEDEGMGNGPPGEERTGINWTKVAAFFVIFLLIGSVVVFLVLYALSLM